MSNVVCDGYCGKSYNPSELLELNGKSYCNACYVKIRNESLELQSLKHCIQSIFKHRPTKMMLNQINKYHDTNKWSYKNIRLTLQYMVEIKEMKMDSKYGIGLVPHYYDEMIDFYKEQIRKKEQTEKAVKKSKHVKVKKKQNGVHKFNKGLMIDIEGIDEENE